MKVLLIVAGVLFLLLAFVLFIAAIVVFFMVRKRRTEEAVAAPAPIAPVVQPVSNVPVAMTPLPPPPLPPLAPADDDRTVLTTPRGQLFGALHGTAGPLAGRIFPIDATGFFIGRDRMTAQAVIDSPSISKRHVWIGVRDGVVLAIDQSSTNGTFLNDPNAAITETRLNPGDTLILGGDVARFEYRA